MRIFARLILKMGGIDKQKTMGDENVDVEYIQPRQIKPAGKPPTRCGYAGTTVSTPSPHKNLKPLRNTPLLWLTVFLTLGAGDAQAVTVCPDPPGSTLESGDSISCEEDDTSTDNIRIIAHGIDIDTTGVNGVFGWHQNTGNVDITAHRNAEIITKGTDSHGIYGCHTSAGDIIITTNVGNSITTTEPGGHGIVGHHAGTGNTRIIDITVNGNIDASGDGARAHGLRDRVSDCVRNWRRTVCCWA